MAIPSKTALGLVKPRLYQRAKKPAPVPPKFPGAEPVVGQPADGSPRSGLKRPSGAAPEENPPSLPAGAGAGEGIVKGRGLHLVPAWVPVPALPKDEAPLPDALESLLNAALATCVSNATRRVYRVQLEAFFRAGYLLEREGVACYLQMRREAGGSPATMHSIIAAIRKLAKEARLQRLLTADEYEGIAELKPGKLHKTRMGQWLTIPQVEELLSLPDRTTLRGRRDAVILGVLVGCGLRRTEMAEIPWTCYQKREGRMCLVDLLGKGNRRRTVPIPSWLLNDLEAWKRDCEGIGEATLITGRWKEESDQTLIAGGVKGATIQDIVQDYGTKMGLTSLNPHDMRRTMARMLQKAGADLEQIQYMLGHSSLTVTVVYLGNTVELTPGLAAVDKIKLYDLKNAQTLSELPPELYDRVRMATLLERWEEELASRNQDELPEGSD